MKTFYVDSVPNRSYIVQFLASVGITYGYIESPIFLGGVLQAIGDHIAILIIIPLKYSHLQIYFQI